jgi:hypothetical protein
MKNSWKLVLFLFLTTGSHAADFGFGVGVKGGFPFTDALEITGVTAGLPPALSQDTSYIVGPVAELRLPFGFAFEVDGLYRSADYQVVNAGTLPTAINSSSWEFPYLAKFRFPIPLLKPFIVAGGAYRIFNDLPSEVTPTRNAFVGGAGLELRTGRLRLSGEVRYLRWGESPENAIVRLTRSQGEVLFGLIF